MTAKETQKKKIGRPRAFNSPEEFTEKAEAWLLSCKGKNGRWLEQPTKGGLAIYLDVTKETLSEYSTNHGKEFADAIKKIYSKIEQSWTQRLTKDYPTGSIFYLKNAFKEDWRDRYDHTSDGEKLPAPVIVMYGPKDRLAQVMEKRKK